MSKKLTKAIYDHPDKLGAGAKKRKGLNKFDMTKAIMTEFRRGTLRSGSGEHVTDPAQAKAIAMSVTKQSKKGKL